jgi:hypothetical protein
MDKLLEENYMGINWKKKLAKCFEDHQILISSIHESREKFDNFCEFIAEPALENLKEELLLYKVGSKIQNIKGLSISFQTNFVKSSISQFHYMVYLPKNSIQLVLYSRVGGRKNKKGGVEMNEEHFMDGIVPSAVMDITQEDFIYEVIQHYRNFLFTSTVSSE